MRLVGFLLGVALLAGCLGGQTGPRANEIQTPSASALETLGLNLTACRGSTILVYLPKDVTQDALPPAYEAFEQIPGFSAVVHKALNCRKAAVDGSDVGEASLLFTSISIRPSPQRRVPEGWGEAFLLEIGSNSSEVSSFLGTGLVQPWVVDVSQTFTSVTPSQELVRGVVTRQGLPVYEFDFSPESIRMKRGLSFRAYTGGDYLSDYYDFEASYLESRGSGVGRLTGAPDSAVARIAGVNSAPVLGNRYHELNELVSFEGESDGTIQS